LANYNLRKQVLFLVWGQHFFDGGATVAINEQKLHELLGKGIVDFGATFHAALIAIGDKLSLYKGLAAGGHQTN
jgi:hypothetical protein